MSPSTSHRDRETVRRGAYGGSGGSYGGDDEDGGGGGGGDEPLVRVAFARSLPEAELLQGLLTEAGIPSVLKRTAPYDVPELLAAGPRDVYVSRGQAVTAKEVLADTMVESEDEELRELEEQRRLARGETGLVSPGRLAFWIGVVGLGGFILAWLLYQAT
jgi:hypothetical protein